MWLGATRLPVSLLLSGVIAFGLARPAAAAEHVGTRPLGMGGAQRAAASGGAGFLLNPSGISLSRAYIVEGAYQWHRRDGRHQGHASIVDSTSGLNVGGALYYTYTYADPEGAGLTSSDHEGGAALSFPLGDRLSIGSTIKYARTTISDPAVTDDLKASGITFDIGVTARPVSNVAVAAVGYNLRELDRVGARRAFGGGLALTAVTNLLVAADGLLQPALDGDDNRLTIAGGAEYVVANRVGLRAGGGRDGVRENAYAAGGASLLSEIGALDVGVRQDLSGSSRETFVAVSARLFVPSP